MAEVTDTHRKVIFSFIRMIGGLQAKDSDAVQAVSQMLGEQFDVDAAGVGGQHDAGIDLLEVFDKTTKAEVSAEDEEKFVAFCEVLKKKGYLKEGSDDYEDRLQKARAKFNARNNPYEGLDADQLKIKGNELVGQAKYKEAIGFYTKAIELTPTNHILFANRAAAHTHLKDFKSAVIDCEKSISLCDTYAKAFSRLGTALVHDGNVQRAADAYERACELEPTNETYKSDLADIREKVSQTAAPVPAGGMPGMPGMPGGPDFGNMMSMMNNPQFMDMARNMMSNPEFSKMAMNMASSMGGAGGAPSEEAFQQMLQGSRTPDEQGNITTPFGKVNHEKLEGLRSSQKDNPKMQAIMEDVRANGYGAFQKYMQDPEVMQMMSEFSTMFPGMPVPMLALSSLAPPQRARLFEALVSSDIITTDASHDGVTVVAQLPAHLLADISSAEQKGRVEGTVGHVTENPPSPRTPHKSLPWLRRFIDDVLAARWQSFSTRQHADTDVVDDLSCHLFRFISCRHGVGNSVRRATETVLLAVQHYRGVDLGVQLFSALLSSGTFDTTDVHFFIACRLALEPFVVLCPETRDPTLQFVRARHVPALLRKCVRGHPMAGRVLRRCLAASPRWLDAHGRTPDVARDPRYYAPPFSNEHAYVSQPSTPAVDEGRFDSFDAALLVPAAQLLAVLLLNSKEERLHPSLQTTGAEALRRRQPSVSSMTTASFARARVKVRPAALDLPVSMDDYTELYRAAAASPEVPLPL